MTSGYAIATLVVFIISIIFVIRPVTIPTPRHWPRIPINLTTAPILAIALLWAAQCLDPAVIRNGIVGTEGIKPYNILILFFSLAYMAITLDITGVLEAAAFWVSNMGGHNGWKLYLYFYVMLTLLSILLGNDPVILSGTAFLVYYTKVAKLDPWAWVMAEFAAANTASMVLFVGNPTNVVICEGFGVNDAAFTAYTILPFLACNVFCFAVLAFQYRNKVPRTLARTAHQDPREALLDPVGAWVGSIMLGATLILCLVVSFFGIDVWMISLPFAVGKFLFDLTWDHYRRTHGIPIKLGRGSPEADGLEKDSAAEREQYTENGASQPTVMEQSPSSLPDEEMDTEPKTEPRMSPKADEKALDEVSETHQHTKDSSSRYPSLANTRRSQSFPHDEETAVESHPEIPKPDAKAGPQSTSTPEVPIKIALLGRWFRLYLEEHFPTFNTALPRLPFALIPFAFSQFILIEALNHQGWVQVFANWLVRASGKQIQPTIWLIGVLGVILCNLAGTNIGATILLTKVVRAAALPYDANRAAAIALAVASNVGAVSFTFSASLAGLLWRTILSQKGTHVKQKDFALWNLLPILAMTGVGLGVVSAEMAVLFQS
ncbi:hypothetical protein L210DRAFT_3559112 [Boletus edulis BED1]|uniref:Citrate transporter-like domain-containing protein n=1 Tax=Boletus edulis BED1 TaxID=1328754 RepID=A0AAD4BIJ9_BOLED|nr:hypothetical protein L210DRAFT_3559112 [Boletus edulis BED1]